MAIVHMESVHFVIEEIEENKAVIAYKNDLASKGRQQVSCGYLLSMKGSTEKNRQQLYREVLRVYEGHYQRFSRDSGKK